MRWPTTTCISTAGGAYPGTTKLLLSEYLKYLPALGRLGATNLVRALLPGGNTIAAEVPEP